MISAGRTRSRPYGGSLSLKIVAASIALSALCLAILFGPSRILDKVSGRGKSAEVSAKFIPEEPAVPRKIYPLSVIHGGVYSPEELARARRTDTVVAAHYADFGSTPKFHKLSQDAMMYVSYRRSDRVYWTPIQHRIPRGEMVISDGTSLARARCGNRLSATPQSPVAPAGPTEEVLNTPESPEAPVSYALAELPGPEELPFQFFLPDRFDQGAGPSAGSGGTGSPGGSGPGGPASGFLGGPGGIGGSGPFPVSGGTKKSASAGPGPRTGGASGLPTSTTGGSTLPTSPTYPGTAPTPISVPGTAPGELVPEPGAPGYLLCLAALVALGLSGRSGLRVLRRQIR